MVLLRLISLQYVRKHFLRTFLTLIGIVLGVAVFVGMHTANQSVLFAFQKTIDRIAGAAQLQVTASETGFDEGVLDQVREEQGVRVASPVVEAVVHTALSGQGNMLVLGVDMLGDRSLREYDLEGEEDGTIDDPLVFLAQPDSLIITKDFAERTRLTTNGKLTLDTASGPKVFIVRGIMKSGGLTSAFGGNLAVMDIYAAQKMFGRGQKFDRIDLAMSEGVRLEDLQARLRARLGAGFQVDPPNSRGAQFEAVTSVYQVLANITSLFALFIGMFIIYNTFAIAVTQRRGEIGILRALGATERQVRLLFLAESAVAGLVASVAGVIFGMLIARGLAEYIGAFMGEVYGISERAQQISAKPSLIATALLIGVATSVIAAVIPSRNAARIDPVKALQKGRYQSFSEGENRTRRIIAIGGAAVAVLCLILGQHGLLLYLGFLLTVASALLLTPVAGMGLSSMLRPVLKKLRPVEGTLAADSLIQSPRRTSGTLAALMLSIGLVISLAGMARASYQSIASWMGRALNPDLFVTPSAKVTDRTYHADPAIADELRAVPGIEAVYMVRNPRVSYRGRPVMVVSTDLDGLVARTGIPVLQGAKDAFHIAAEGKGVIVADNLATVARLKVGDMFEIGTPSGTMQLPIVGIVMDYSDQQGSVLVDRSVYLKYWKDPMVDIFRVYLKPGTVQADVIKAIQEKVGSHNRLFVLTNRDLRDYVRRITDQWFGLTYIQIAVAVLVAVLGIINTLTVSITDRRRELGVLQAVGALRNQVRRTVWIESLAIGFLGLVLGLALGAVELYYGLEISRRDIAGFRLDYQFPVEIAVLLIPVILGAAFVAAIGPAESAVRGSLVEALEYE